MAIGQLNSLLLHVRRLAGATAVDEQSDEQLLSRFQADRAESAFSALMQRHGKVVWNVCRRVLGHEQDAEDAFQATFLVLARKAGSIRNTEAVGSWLHGAAYRIAMRAKRDAGIRRKHELHAPGAHASGPLEREISLREGLTIVDEEVNRLGARHRAVFIACCLEGKTTAEAARELGWKEGTVSGTQSRAKAVLRSRLARRGLTLSAALAALALSESAVVAMPVKLVVATLQAAIRYAAGGPAPAALAPLIRAAGKVVPFARVKIAAVMLTLAGVAAACSLAMAPNSPQDAKSRKEPPNAKQEAGASDSVEVNGRVLDPDGKAFTGAKLYLRYQNFKETDYPVRATSDADGKFSFAFKRSLLDESSPNTSWFVVLATAEGYGPDWTYQAKPQAGVALNLRLVKDVPIGGRILDVNGKPVKGAKLRIEHTEAWADTEVFLQSVRDREWARVDSKSWFGPFPGRSATLTTDAEGRFRLTGIGKDRLVQFQVQGPKIQWGPMRAMAREMKAPVEPRKVRFAEGPAFDPVYPATYDHVFQPSRLIRGVVRDKKTGRPIPGIAVHGYGTTDSATTDAEGRFTLDGFGKSAGGAYGMSVRPPGERYFSRSASFPDTPGLGPVEGEIELVSGIVVRGRITHQMIGKPIEGAQVFYNPLVPNPHVRWFGPNGAGVIPLSSTTSGSDGSYSLVVLPGPGVLGFIYGTTTETFMPALLTAQDLKEFFKEGADHSNENMLRIQMTENGFNAISQVQFNHLLLIKPAETDESLTRDVALQPAKPLKGKVIGPDGKPLTGVLAYNLERGIVYQPLPDDTFTVKGVNPQRVRDLLFIDKERKHGAFLALKGEQKEPLTVRLEPCGVATGRLLDQDGEPVAGAVVRLDVEGPYDSGPLKVKTDGKGRFRSEGIVPGQRHQARFGLPPFGQYLYKPFTLKSGESKDLGDERVKPKQ
jgi:RNA polymerase sigma factor (sigma-70 family)